MGFDRRCRIVRSARAHRVTMQAFRWPLLVIVLLGSQLAAARPTMAATAPAFTEFPQLPSAISSPTAIAVGPDGAFWFGESDKGRIGRIDAAGTLTEFPLPVGSYPSYGIASGPDGAMWYTSSNGDDGRIGRITTQGQITEYSVPTAFPWGIAAGPDGALWVTEKRANAIARVSTSGSISTYAIPTAGTGPTGISLGADSALWFAEQDGNAIGRIDVTGAVTEFPIVAPCYPSWTTPGPDGAVWFTCFGGGQIGRISVAGAISLWQPPTTFSDPATIAAGPDGALWFTEWVGCCTKIGRITTAGAITEFPIPTPKGQPWGIVAGPDNDSMWFTERGPLGNRIANIHNLAPDTLPPIVNGFPDRLPNDAGWYRAPVTVTWSVIDPAPSSGAPFLPPPTVVSTDGGGQTVTSALSCDPAGNCGSGNVTLNVDLTPPVLVLTVLPLGNAADWNNTAVTISATCSDVTSGIALGACPAPTTIAAEGRHQVAGFSTADVAGNSTTATKTVSIDLSPPTVLLHAPAPGSTIFASQYVAPTCDAYDALSGLNGICSVSVTALSSSGQSTTYLAVGQASDLAGNEATQSSTYTVVYDTMAPTIVPTPSTPANEAGWWNSSTTWSFSCTDDSGVSSCPAPHTVSTEGAGQWFTVTAADIFGNVATLVVSGINIDKTSPTLVVSMPTSAVPTDVVTISCAASDALSGLAYASCADRTLAASTLTPGINSFIFSAEDLARNQTQVVKTVNLVITPLNVGALVGQYLENTPGANGLTNSLVTKLEAGNLAAFAAELNAQCCRPDQPNKRFTQEQVATLIRLAGGL